VYLQNFSLILIVVIMYITEYNLSYLRSIEPSLDKAKGVEYVCVYVCKSLSNIR